MCSAVLAWLGPALGCVVFGTIGWVASKSGEPRPPSEDDVAIERFADVELRIFRTLRHVFLLGGVGLTVGGVVAALNC